MPEKRLVAATPEREVRDAGGWAMLLLNLLLLGGAVGFLLMNAAPPLYARMRAGGIIWRLENTAHAAFDVEHYTRYVEMHSESAIRSIASRYSYDHGEEHETTLRGGAEASPVINTRTLYT
jgi:hypothetical protein